MSDEKVFLSQNWCTQHAPAECWQVPACAGHVCTPKHVLTRRQTERTKLFHWCFLKQPRARCPGTPDNGMCLTVMPHSTRERCTFLRQIKVIFECIITTKQEPQIFGWSSQLYIPHFPSPGREPQPPGSSILLSLQWGSPLLQPRYTDSQRPQGNKSISPSRHRQCRIYFGSFTRLLLLVPVS